MNCLECGAPECLYDNSKIYCNACGYTIYKIEFSNIISIEKGNVKLDEKKLNKINKFYLDGVEECSYIVNFLNDIYTAEKTLTEPIYIFANYNDFLKCCGLQDKKFFANFFYARYLNILSNINLKNIKGSCKLIAMYYKLTYKTYVSELKNKDIIKVINDNTKNIVLDEYVYQKKLRDNRELIYNLLITIKSFCDYSNFCKDLKKMISTELKNIGATPCNVCNSSKLKPLENGWQCLSCGHINTKINFSTAKNEDMIIAKNELQKANFEQAKKLYDNIIQKYKNQDLSSVYFNMFLADREILFEEDIKTGNNFPTFYNSIKNQTQSCLEYYNKAILEAEKYGNIDGKKLYQELYSKIVKIQKLYENVELYEKPYQIFISFKATDDNGNYTTDKFSAEKIYNEYKDRYNIFYSPISLSNTAGIYEPYIYHALYTSKIMLLICSREDYINSQWVRNEWSRFEELASTNDKNNTKIILPILYGNFNENDLPMELKSSCYGNRTYIKENDLIGESSKLYGILIRYLGYQNKISINEKQINDEKQLNKIQNNNNYQEQCDEIYQENFNNITKSENILSREQQGIRQQKILIEKKLNQPELYTQKNLENIEQKDSNKMCKLSIENAKKIYCNGIYEGEIDSNGKRNGKGIFTCEKGNTYKGEWSNDKINGKGVYYYANGNKLEGNFVNGVPFGYCKYTYKNGNYCEGYYNNEGKRIGKFTYCYTNGEKYIGYLNGDIKEGYGEYTYQDGDKYIGEWKDNKKNGLGEFIYGKNSINFGDRYKGYWKEDFKYGKGTYIFANGGRYDGIWLDDYRCGYGKLIYGNGDNYEGDFLYNKKCGYGTYRWSTGEKYVGDWQDNKKHGKGIYYLSNGDYYEGVFCQDVFKEGIKNENGKITKIKK